LGQSRAGINTDDIYTTIPSGFDFSALSESFVFLLSKDDSTASGFNILSGIIPDTIECPGDKDSAFETILPSWTARPKPALG
jgi:hypothetical protein